MSVESNVRDMLKFLEDEMHKEDYMDPDGAYVFMSPEQRKITKIKIELLRSLLK